MNEMSPMKRNASGEMCGSPRCWSTAGLVTVGLSLAELRAQGACTLAQATGTPAALQARRPRPLTNKPAESMPGGTRPTTPAPEPARPSAEAQKEGAKPALPPAPAEKMAPPIKDK